MGARIRGVLQHLLDEGVSTGKLFGADVDAEGAERILYGFPAETARPNNILNELAVMTSDWRMAVAILCAGYLRSLCPIPMVPSKQNGSTFVLAKLI